ncbi:MAG: hypothetical protein H6559_23430 [Lewinellaceae bacterium]|nr:hypothetical protein [Lewinellaceae bacterium]
MPEKRPTPKPHQTRPVRFLQYLFHEEWTAKIYGICQDDERPGETLLQCAREITRLTLPAPRITEERYALAFVIITTINPALLTKPPQKVSTFFSLSSPRLKNNFTVCTDRREVIF